MNITQSFYNNIASQYDKLFLDWRTTMQEQAVLLNGIFQENGFDHTARILDCACGIGTQAIGLSMLGYDVTASDLSDGELKEAKKRAAENDTEIVDRIEKGGMFVASIRDYDALLQEKPTYSAPYIHKTDSGQRVSFQTWEWHGDNYRFIQYIIDDAESLQISKFECEYRATRREELTNLLLANGCSEVTWKSPEETGFYQPIVIAGK